MSLHAQFLCCKIWFWKFFKQCRHLGSFHCCDSLPLGLCKHSRTCFRQIMPIQEMWWHSSFLTAVNEIRLLIWCIFEFLNWIIWSLVSIFQIAKSNFKHSIPLQTVLKKLTGWSGLPRHKKCVDMCIWDQNF